jgi:hypothetical protein
MPLPRKLVHEMDSELGYTTFNVKLRWTCPRVARYLTSRPGTTQRLDIYERFRRQRRYADHHNGAEVAVTGCGTAYRLLASSRAVIERGYHLQCPARLP